MNKSKIDLLREVRQKKISIDQALKKIQDSSKNQSSTSSNNAVATIIKNVAKSEKNDIDWQVYLRNDLLNLVAKILKLEPEKIHPDVPIVNLGLDSLSATEFNNLMINQYKVKISPTIFFECNTINDFHSYLTLHHSLPLKAYYHQNKLDIAPDEKSANLDSPDHTDIVSAGKTPDSLSKKSPSYLEQLWVELEQNYDREYLQLDSQDIAKVSTNSVILQNTRRLVIYPPQGLAIEVFVAGQGEPLLLLGGLLNSEEIWSNQLEILKKNHQLIIFNKPGCGKSEINFNTLTLDLIINNILIVLDTLNIDNPLTVMGYSFGGMLAQLLCLNYPQRVKSLIIACSTPYTNEDKIEPNLLLKELVNNQQFKEIIINVNLKNIHPYHRAVNGFNILADLEEIKVPTLILAGQEDKYMSPAYSQAIHQAIPYSQYQEIEGAGHLPLLTHPQDFNSKVSDFLASLSAHKNPQLAQ